MKYHISPKQAKEITEEQFYSMFDEIVPRKDWANYHHRKMDIGKMIAWNKRSNLTLEIPDEQILWSDFNFWHHVLNIGVLPVAKKRTSD